MLGLAEGTKKKKKAFKIPSHQHFRLTLTRNNSILYLVYRHPCIPRAKLNSSVLRSVVPLLAQARIHSALPENK